MTRFDMFTNEELDAMELAFCKERLIYLIDEIHRERGYREYKKIFLDSNTENEVSK